MHGWLGRKRTIEDRLRDERPQPSDELVRSIASTIESRANRTRTPFRLIGLTAAVVAGLAAIGGLGYAATYTTRVVAIITGTQVVHSTRVVKSSARAQYGTTTDTTTTTTEASTSTSTTTTSTTTGSGGEAATTASPSSSGSVSTENPNDTSHPVSASWSAGTFSAPTTVTVDPTPTVGGNKLSLQAGSVVISITATTTGGQAVTTLAAPLEVVIGNPPAGFVPAVSTDGVNFRALTNIAPSRTLSESQQDGYFSASDGIHILTRHLTIFGVIAKTDVNVSESGRHLAPANSGRWGDAALVHSGPPVFRIATGPTGSGSVVTLKFFVDEQAAMYFHVLSGTKELTLLPTSTVGTAKVGGKENRTLHVSVLHPRTVPVVLRLKKPAGKLSVQISAVDFDGNKVTRTATVK